MTNFFTSFTIHYTRSLSIFASLSDSSVHKIFQPSRLLCSWDFSGKNIGVGCHFPPPGMFPSQGSNPHLLSPALQVDSLPAEPSGKTAFYKFTKIHFLLLVSTWLDYISQLPLQSGVHMWLSSEYEGCKASSTLACKNIPKVLSLFQLNGKESEGLDRDTR